MTAESSRQWVVYIIRTDDDLLYTGITTDLARRWQQHSQQRAGAKFFRGRKPAALVYVEKGHDRSSASRREAAIKQLARSAKELLLRAASNDLAKLNLELV
ncbi:MAG TPA: GIY-YIG nuclease family protein [Spongiibacteraceae bacterium]|nr:GIY-YIG nuclease family protein [Spongiibacteraceae bacterium]